MTTLETSTVSSSSVALKDLLAEAQEIVSTIDDAEMRRIAFGPVLERLLSENGADEERPAVEANGASERIARTHISEAPADDSYVDASQRADSISRFLGIEPAKALDLFNLDETAPDLQAHSKSIPSGKAEGTRAIALLICSARTALGIETATLHVKEAADRYGRYDAGNFMKTLTAMSEIAVRGKPKSSNRVIRLRVTGQEAARELAASL